MKTTNSSTTKRRSSKTTTAIAQAQCRNSTPRSSHSTSTRQGGHQETRVQYWCLSGVCDAYLGSLGLLRSLHFLEPIPWRCCCFWDECGSTYYTTATTTRVNIVGTIEPARNCDSGRQRSRARGRGRPSTGPRALAARACTQRQRRRYRHSRRPGIPTDCPLCSQCI